MKYVFVGEMRVGSGIVHGPDLAKAMGVEHNRSLPKKGDVTILMGRLLAGKKTATLIKAESRGVPQVPVESVLTDEVKTNLKAILSAKPHQEWYERAALAALTGQPAVPAQSVEAEKPKRGKGRKSKKVAAA